MAGQSTRRLTGLGAPPIIVYWQGLSGERYRSRFPIIPKGIANVYRHTDPYE